MRVRRVGKWLLLAFLLLPIVLFAGPRIGATVVGGDFYAIPSGSMKPTLLPGDQIVALPFWSGDLPARGTVVTLEYPRKPGVTYVSRVAGLPGDRVQMIGGVLHLNGLAVGMTRAPDYHEPKSIDGAYRRAQRCLNDPVALHAPCAFEQWIEDLPGGHRHAVLNLAEGGADDTAEITVEPGHVFVLGDNRDNAIDSRDPATGQIPVGNLKEWVWLIQISFDDTGLRDGRLLKRVN